VLSAIAGVGAVDSRSAVRGVLSVCEQAFRVVVVEAFAEVFVVEGEA